MKLITVVQIFCTCIVLVTPLSFQHVAAQSHVSLVGIATKGGAFGAGTIYTVNEDGSDFRVLHDFDVLQGQQPYGTVVQGTDGFLYGTTTKGGLYEAGTIFKMTADGSAFSVIHNFVEEYPYGGLLLGSNGALFGVTESGGDEGIGVI